MKKDRNCMMNQPFMMSFPTPMPAMGPMMGGPMMGNPMMGMNTTSTSSCGCGNSLASEVVALRQQVNQLERRVCMLENKPIATPFTTNSNTTNNYDTNVQMI